MGIASQHDFLQVKHEEEGAICGATDSPMLAWPDKQFGFCL